MHDPFDNHSVPGIEERWETLEVQNQLLRSYQEQIQLAQLHEHGWPDALIKASQDCFEYALVLTNGTLIQFQQARPTAGGRFVHLIEPIILRGPGADELPKPLPRGMQVALSQIAWVCDAPHGS